MSLAKSITDYKAVSMNVMHSSMEIIDQFYSNLDDAEIKERISLLGLQVQNDEGDLLNTLSAILEHLKRAQ